ncbi:ROK family protein, partial [Streptomyces sp. NPDC003832]
MYAALDIGGTKIAGALVDDAGVLRGRAELPTPARESASRLADTVDAVIDSLASHPAWGTVRGMGIASAGPVDTANGTVSTVYIPAWRA